MPRPVLEVRGAREFRRTLKAAGADLEDLKRANAEAGAIVATRGRGIAPRVTGRLAASIRPGRAVASAVVRAGGARVPYAAPIHWGWARRNIRPQPFLLEAADDTREQWFARYVAGVQTALDRVKGIPS